MIPKCMSQFLQEALPGRTWQNRLHRQDSGAFMEFGPLDVDRLQRIGIEVDRLGPHLVVCMWDEDSPLEIGGYLVIDNLSMGQPSMGGIRMLPDVKPNAIFNLARGMTLKNAAADLPYGGGKSGIVAPEALDPQERLQVIQGFARLLHRYHHVYLPGPDVGTNDQDMRTIAIENGLNCALSKTVDMGGNRIDQLGSAARGVVVAINTLLEEFPKLRVLPQFAHLQVPSREEISILIQGFGAVGTHVARLLTKSDMGSSPRIVGVSDETGYLYDENSLPVSVLLACQQQFGTVAYPYFHQELAGKCGTSTKYSNDYNDLLRESAFCLVPAAPTANYLDVDASSNPSMTVDRMGDWAMIVEGANTYSPDPVRRAARARMERAVYWQKGVLIATDFLVNSGGVIYAAQEHLIKAPDHLKIPQPMLGDREAVDGWLTAHKEEFTALAETRRVAGEIKLKQVIERNMRELIDLLVSDPDMLPSEAAETIAISRITSRERDRTVSDVMEPISTIRDSNSVRDAAKLLVCGKGDMLAVVSSAGDLVGVVTDWDITQASATACADDVSVTSIMTREVITSRPTDSILDVVRKLEHYDISAMPVITDQGVIGVISSDILALRTLYRLLQAQNETF
jgi:glutamate dehydrogenase/leucine dehydrogenase/predicted transcriptional regulator